MWLIYVNHQYHPFCKPVVAALLVWLLCEADAVTSVALSAPFRDFGAFKLPEYETSQNGFPLVGNILVNTMVGRNYVVGHPTTKNNCLVGCPTPPNRSKYHCLVRYPTNCMLLAGHPTKKCIRNWGTLGHSNFRIFPIFCRRASNCSKWIHL